MISRKAKTRVKGSELFIEIWHEQVQGLYMVIFRILGLTVTSELLLSSTAIALVALTRHMTPNTTASTRRPGYRQQSLSTYELEPYV